MNSGNIRCRSLKQGESVDSRMAATVIVYFQWRVCIAFPFTASCSVRYLEFQHVSMLYSSLWRHQSPVSAHNISYPNSSVVMLVLHLKL